MLEENTQTPDADSADGMGSAVLPVGSGSGGPQGGSVTRMDRDKADSSADEAQRAAQRLFGDR